MTKTKSRIRSAIEGALVFFCAMLLLNLQYLAHKPTFVDKAITVVIWILLAVAAGLTFDATFRYLWPKISHWHSQRHQKG